ncbi:gamma-glutamyl-gamma-aminobutyrate hydrolase family protein [Amphibiibacter pelophylacis]|uniref:Gamma-glutamyl-gamma-aminobutyrate hydrolase family protein n=1 Tax=Amphibiibacter pelophylacis TaxID=1799477 RepID=A0ACC6P419_9BURK
MATEAGSASASSRAVPVRIGISTYPVNPDDRYTLPAAYVAAVVRAGGTPLLLPPVGAAHAAVWLDGLDGLVLAGGGDIDPERYQGRGHDTIYNLSAERDSTELALARLALDGQLPTLAVCRGLQIINTLLGGSLHPHLPDVVGEATLHRAPPRDPVPHAVRVEAGSGLAALIGEQVETASWHHQAVDRLADGLTAVAWAPDGVIEAVESAQHPQLMAVQWHPELTADIDSSQQRLFDQLVAWARTRRA